MLKQAAIGVAVLLLILAGTILIIFQDNIFVNFRTGSVPALVSKGFSLDFAENLSVKTLSDGSGFFSLTNSRAARFDNDGILLWEHPLNYTNPTFVSNGSYIAVSQLRGRTYHAFSAGGIIYTINFDNDILNYNIASNGYSAVLTGSEIAYSINVFNRAGTLVWSRTIEDRSLFPISMAVSPGGNILAVSYLDISGPTVMSYICAYYIDSEIGTESDEGLFALFRHVEGEIIHKVEFIDETHLMFCSDTELGVYELDELRRVNHRWSKNFDNHITFVETVANVGVAVAFGRPLLNREGLEEGSFIVYSPTGSELASFVMEGAITYLSTGSDAAIIGGGPLGRSFTALTYRNRIAWNYIATSDVLDFVILDRPGRALLVTPSRMMIMETP